MRRIKYDQPCAWRDSLRHDLPINTKRWWRKLNTYTYTTIECHSRFIAIECRVKYNDVEVGDWSTFWWSDNLIRFALPLLLDSFFISWKIPPYREYALRVSRQGQIFGLILYVLYVYCARFRIDGVASDCQWLAYIAFWCIHCLPSLVELDWRVFID